MSTTLRADDLLKRASAVANYYGFSSLSSVAAFKKSSSRAPYPDGFVLEGLDPVAREVAGFFKHVRDTGLAPTTAQPLFLWHTNAAPGRPAPKQVIIQFHALGSDRAIADAVLIRAVRAFMQDFSKTELRLRLNSMGDRETRSRFARELTSFFRRHSAALPPDCVDCAKRDVMEAAQMLANSESDSLPSPTDHLSESSRKHFEAVLEYLENTDTPYELSPGLLSRGTTWTETCFEVSGEGHTEGQMYAWGSRYQELTKLFFKGHTPGMGAVIRINMDSREQISPVKAPTAPRFFFVHIGDEAKRVSMMMADDIRRARIPLSQSIGIESLTEQMRYVETANPRYVLIMGRKEALERNVILRERATHTEVSIPLDSLIARLKIVA